MYSDDSFATYKFGHGILVSVMCTVGSVLLFREYHIAKS